MRYGQGLLEEILRRTDLVQLVSRRVKLVRKGKVMWGCCPFHAEKSPSFKVDNERRSYKCFGCGAGGDAFRWLMESEGQSFPEAVAQLAETAGIELPKWSDEDEARQEKKKSLYDVVEAAASYFERELAAPQGAVARGYLDQRGVDRATTARFRLGYAPQGRAGLIAHLSGLGIALDDLVAAGLARPAEAERPARDFFFHRLMFPITDSRGRVIGFGARALDPATKPKYLNTADTVLFSKGQNLYNLAAARAAALKNGTIILAEGYMDVIALERAGFAHAVAPLGTALTEDQLALLWRVAAEPILAFDGDEAGRRAASRAAHLALPHLKPGQSLRFAFLPAGEDPDSLIATFGPATMRQRLEQADPLIEVLWRELTENKDFATPERRAGLEKSLMDLVARMGDRSIAEHYRRAFRQKLVETFSPVPARVSRSLTPGRAAWRGAQLPAYRRDTVSAAVKNSPMARAGAARPVKETEVMALLLEAPTLVLTHAELVAALPLADAQLDRLRHELLNLAASGIRLEFPGLQHHLERAGLAELVQRLAVRRAIGAGAAEQVPDGVSARQGGTADVEESETRWLAAVAQLRLLADLGAERTRALDRFNREPSEENWRDLQRLVQAAQRQDT
ncbi:MAG: DNA primase [Rhizomicrobium sp.]